MKVLDEKVDLTSGGMWENIISLSWPMLVIMFLNFLVGAADVYVAGLLSPETQAAVGFVSQIFFLTIILANAISIGSVALVARAEGSGDSDRAVSVARQALLFGGLVAFVITFSGLGFYSEIVEFAGIPKEIAAMAGDFLMIYALALGFNYMLIISNAIFRASGEVKKPLVTMTAVSFLNIALNFIFVFGFLFFPAMGYIGIAAASAVSVAIGVFINFIFFYYGRWSAIFRRPLSLSMDIVKKIFSISWPSAALQIAWNAGSIILYNILGRLGDASITALAAITNGFRIEAVIFLPAFAFNMAAAALIGQNLGAGNPDRAEQLGWRISKASVALVSAMSVVVFIFAEDIASFFTSDGATLEETIRYLRFNMLSEPFMALSVTLAGALQGAGDTRGSMWVVITAMWLIRLPLAYFFAILTGYGATGVWLAMVVSMLIQGVLMSLRFKSGKWKAIKLGAI